MSDKLTVTRHNGRSGKNGTYNPKHNDRSFNVENSEHINTENGKLNVYWDYVNGLSTWESRSQNDDNLELRFEYIEKKFYDDNYSDYCSGQHERNRVSGHSGRDRSTDDLRLNKKTCPEETIIQIGSMEKHVDHNVLLEIASQYFEKYRELFGEHVHIIDWALHCDEATPHIHERHVFDTANQYGEIAPQQEKALEALGIERPFPDKPNSSLNNRKVVFDSICRTMLIDICKEHGLVIEEIPQYGGRDYLEKQEYIIQKQNDILEKNREKLVDLDRKIKDKESFIDELAETAYNKAVNEVAKKAIEETRRQDIDTVKEHRDDLAALLGRERYKSLFEALLSRLEDMKEFIMEKVLSIFSRNTEKQKIKDSIKEEVKKKMTDKKDYSQMSIQERLRQPLDYSDEYKRKKARDYEERVLER